MARLSYLLLLTLLVSCTAVESTNEVTVDHSKTQSEQKMTLPAPAAPPPPPRVVTMAPKPMAEAKVVLSRDYLLRTDALPENPLNIVYFPHRPTGEKETAVYLRICETWKSAFPLSKEVHATVTDKSKISLIPLYWPLAKPSDDESCEYLVANYDYARASILVTDLSKFNLSRRQLISLHDRAYISLDLSKMVSVEHLTTAFDAWRTEISKRPTDGGVINPYTLVASAKDVLGALSSFITLKKNT